MVSAKDIADKYKDYLTAKGEIEKEIYNAIEDKTVTVTFDCNDELTVIIKEGLSHEELDYIINKGFTLFELTRGSYNCKYVFDY